MALLIDSDAFCKLGVAGLLEDAAGLFGLMLGDSARLPALPYMLRRGALVRRFGIAACNTLLPIAEELPAIPEADAPLLDRLLRIEAIDPGEAQLLAVAMEHRLTLLTGDKRSLRALKDVPEVLEALSGRIAIIESVLLGLCEQRGVEYIRAHVAVLAGHDTMIQTCFSPDNTDPGAGLTSYLNAIAVDVRPLDLWQPPSSK
jgi:hypothetical protein